MPGVRLTGSADKTWSDTRLVDACVRGQEDAWQALIDKYKRLIFSIPCRRGMTADEAADIFQTVCAELFEALPQLRKAESLRAWLVTVTVHRCDRWQGHPRRYDRSIDAADDYPTNDQPVDAALARAYREESVREAVNQLPERCQRLVRMLFFEQPPRPYRDIAQELGLATGSLGFIRGRCLQRLARLLRDKGL